jgi:hypothetical protein
VLAGQAGPVASAWQRALAGLAPHLPPAGRGLLPEPSPATTTGGQRGQWPARGQLLAQYAPQPAVHPFVVQLGLVAAAGLGLLAVPETVSDRSALSLRFRRLGIPQVLGEDHPDTLRSANSLAIDLANLGEYQAARDLHQDTLIRRRRVLGEDHPSTLKSASNLAANLRALGETVSP